jgi:hypothetical protein
VEFPFSPSSCLCPKNATQRQFDTFLIAAFSASYGGQTPESHGPQPLDGSPTLYAQLLEANGAPKSKGTGALERSFRAIPCNNSVLFIPEDLNRQ